MYPNTNYDISHLLGNILSNRSVLELITHPISKLKCCCKTPYPTAMWKHYATKCSSVTLRAFATYLFLHIGCMSNVHLFTMLIALWGRSNAMERSFFLHHLGCFFSHSILFFQVHFLHNTAFKTELAFGMNLRPLMSIFRSYR